MSEIENWPLDRFIEYINNPRKNDHAVDRVASAINEFGFRVPIIAKSDGTLIDGHLRLKAAKKLDLETVPVLLADDLTDSQIKAFRIAVNQVASIAEFDLDLLKVEIEGLEELDFDLDLLGFEDGFLDAVTDIEMDLPGLPDGDREPFQQKTFTLHDEQATIIDDAIAKARTDPLVDTGINENSNGNALALICERWLAGG